MNLAAHYRFFGVDAIYESASGDTELPLRVIISHDLNQYGTEIQTQAGMAVISIKRGDVPAPPRRNDTFTIGGEVWRMHTMALRDDLEYRVMVTHDD
jgi:hypothetical protein